MAESSDKMKPVIEGYRDAIDDINKTHLPQGLSDFKDLVSNLIKEKFGDDSGKILKKQQEEHQSELESFSLKQQKVFATKFSLGARFKRSMELLKKQKEEREFLLSTQEHIKNLQLEIDEIKDILTVSKELLNGDDGYLKNVEFEDYIRLMENSLMDREKELRIFIKQSLENYERLECSLRIFTKQSLENYERLECEPSKEKDSESEGAECEP